MNTLEFIVLGFVVCLLSHLVYDMIIESEATNIGLLRRLHDDRYNFLAIVYKRIRDEQLAGQTQEQIYETINRLYKDKVFLFQQRNSTSKRYLESLAFVERVINDRTLLFGYVTTSSFGKKEFEKLKKLISNDEKEKQARASFQKILISGSNEDIDKAMRLMKKYLTKSNYINDPNEQDRKIQSVENAFSLLHAGKGILFKNDTTITDYFNAITALKKVYPGITIPSSLGHAGDYNFSMGKYKDRINAIEDALKHGAA